MKPPKRIWVYRNRETQAVSVCVNPVKLSNNYYLIGKYFSKGEALRKAIKQLRKFAKNELGVYPAYDLVTQQLNRMEGK